MNLDALSIDARIIADAVEELARFIEEGDGLTYLISDDLPRALAIREVLAASAAALTGSRQDLDTAIGKALGPDSQLIDGHKIKRHPRLRLSNADDEALLRCVLDSRMVNEATGEIVDETPIDKLKHVWRHPARDARKTALQVRNIDLSEFIESEFLGYSLEIR